MTRLTKSEWIITLAIALATFSLHQAVNMATAYGPFRDELYYLACSDHLDWGYVDQPPFSLLVLKLSRLLLGDGLVALRLVPALLHAGVILLTASITKQMGGHVFAVFISCFVMATTPIISGMMAYYSMNAFDIFIWTLVFLLLLKLQQEKNTFFNWITLGVVLGIGLMNKIAVLFLGSGIFIAMLITARHDFKTKGPYVAALIAFTFFIPYILWNATHDWAHWEFIQNATAGKYSGRLRIDFIADQILNLNPLAAPLWIGGLAALIFYKPLQVYKSFAWIYISVFLILLLNGTSKGEYLAPGYVMLFAAGGIWLGHQVSTAFCWIKAIYISALTGTYVFILPLVMPVLPVEKYIAYAAAIGFAPHSSENKELAQLPQHYADMFGWKEKAHDVANVFQSLNEEEKKKCAIFSTNYGRCGAIDFYGKEYGLPKSIGNHNNYWIWGVREYTGEIMLIAGGTLEDHINNFESCELVKVSTCQYCMPYENNVSIFIARKLKTNLRDVWKEEKHYD